MHRLVNISDYRYEEILNLINWLLLNVLLTKLKSLSQKGKDAKLFLMITIQIIIKFNELVDENLTNCLSKNASLGIVLNAPNQVFDVRKWQL